MENRAEIKYPTPQYVGELNKKKESTLPSKLDTTPNSPTTQLHQPEKYIDKRGNIVTPPHSKPTMYWEGDEQSPPLTIETDFSIK